DLLEVSHGGAEVALKPTDIPALIEEAVAPSREWANVRGLDFTVSIAPEAQGGVWTDGRRLRQILHHLSANAVKFTGLGGVRVVADRRGDHLRVQIHDTGCGMTDEV
ncbi:MAG: sensor histidine kinase, partial [Brevundimonas sp.]|uniref:sensor histidine kinase n=3 Tax=Brevundimonas TaxID=41275 RepID=UPI0040343F9F